MAEVDDNVFYVLGKLCSIFKSLTPHHCSLYETVHTCVLFRTLYIYTVRSIDDPTLLAKMDW